MGLFLAELHTQHDVARCPNVAKTDRQYVYNDVRTQNGLLRNSCTMFHENDRSCFVLAIVLVFANYLGWFVIDTDEHETRVTTTKIVIWVKFGQYRA